MKDFDNSLLIQMSAELSTPFWLVDLSISESTMHRTTSLDIDIAYGGNLYSSFQVQINPISYTLSMSVDKVRLDYSNVSLAMSSIVLNNNIKKRPAIVYLGAMNGLVPVVEAVYYGIVSEWSADESLVEIQVVNEFIFWNKKTLRLPADICQWPFKSTECAYAGAATICNGTYSRCTFLSNTNNFGGSRFLPSLEEKEIYWGKKPI